MRWCARCEAGDDPKLQETYKCSGCAKEKELREYAPVIIRNIVFRADTQYSGGSRPCGLRCQRCQYPTCKRLHGQGCRQPAVKVFFPVPTNAYHKGVYICQACKFPPCACGQERPGRRTRGTWDSSKSALVKGQENWTCPACEQQAAKKTTLYECTYCGAKEKSDFDEKHLKKHVHEGRQLRCQKCRYPQCCKCGHQHGQQQTPYQGDPKEYVCHNCADTFKCSKCGDRKLAAEFDATHLQNHKKYDRDAVCRGCQQAKSLEVFYCSHCNVALSRDTCTPRAWKHRRSEKNTIKCLTCTAAKH